MPIHSAPAKRSTPKTSTAGKPPVTAEARGNAREDGINGIFQIGQAICIMRGWYSDAGALGLHGPNVSRETAKLAETNESIAKGIDYLITLGPYSALIAAIMPLGLQIAANHGRIDPDKAAGLGVHSPEVLEVKVKAEVDRERLKFTQAAQEARDELDRVLKEFPAGDVNAGT